MRLPSLIAALTSNAVNLSSAYAGYLLRPGHFTSTNPFVNLEWLTDRFLFRTSLDVFRMIRHVGSPTSLDWSSDGCTVAHDNPFGFPFEPACHRHDFGYRNYKAQSRLNGSKRGIIDGIFRNDLRFQCQATHAPSSCMALADVYYLSVYMFGGFAKRNDLITEQNLAHHNETSSQLQASYDAALQRYNDAVKQNQADGLLPLLRSNSSTV